MFSLMALPFSHHTHTTLLQISPTREVKLSASEIEAALAVSEALKLNEISAASLVVDARLHTHSHLAESPLAFRALYMYYEARECLLASLKQLLLAREGRTFGRTFTLGFHNLATT